MKTYSNCSYCGRDGHNSLNCYKKRQDKVKTKPKKKASRMRLESKSANNKRQVLKTTFFALNPPDSDGNYTCYLQISPHCPKIIPKHYVTLEHVYAKQSGKYPELKYVVENILPACESCNKSKLSNTPEQLAIFYPHIKEMLETDEWQTFMDRLKQAIKDRNIELYWHEADRVFRRYPS